LIIVNSIFLKLAFVELLFQYSFVNFLHPFFNDFTKKTKRAPEGPNQMENDTRVDNILCKRFGGQEAFQGTCLRGLEDKMAL